MQNTLKNKTLYVFHETSGSQGQLILNDNTSGSYKVGPSSSNVTWSEIWVGNHCALWVIFDDEIKNKNIRIWGFQLTTDNNLIMGTGMSALGNATPQDNSNTTFINEELTISSNPRT